MEEPFEFGIDISKHTCIDDFKYISIITFFHQSSCHLTSLHTNFSPNVMFIKEGSWISNPPLSKGSKIVFQIIKWKFLCWSYLLPKENFLNFWIFFKPLLLALEELDIEKWLRKREQLLLKQFYL